MPDLHDLLARTLLVGLPPDASATDAVRLAYELARRFTTPIELVHAIPEIHGVASRLGWTNVREIEERRRGEIWQERAVELEALGAPPAPLEDLLRLEPGTPPRVLVRRAREVDAGAIVVGPHRRRGVLDLGSTARALLAHAPCAVWCQAGAVRDIQRILVPVDMSEDSRHAWRVAAGLARHLGASVHLVHAFDRVEATDLGSRGVADVSDVIDQLARHARDEFQGFVDSLAIPEGVAVTTEMSESSPAQAILKRHQDHDLVVMGTQGRGKLSAAVLGSVTYSVLRETERSVLAVPHHADLDRRKSMVVDSFHVTA